jgi:hypothetical protein
MPRKTTTPYHLGSARWLPVWLFLGLGLMANAQTTYLTNPLNSASGNIVTNCTGTPPSGCSTASNSSQGYTQNVTLLAGSEIVLGPGFQAAATSTSSFTALIGAPLAINPVPANAPNTYLLPSATAGGFYSFTITASGGFPPYSYIPSTYLPPDLLLSPGGVLSGTPAGAASYSGASALGIRVTDATGASATAFFSLTVTSPTLLTGVSCSGSYSGSTLTYTASPNVSGYTYSWSGTVNSGTTTSLDSISYTPSKVGNYSESVVVMSTSGSIGSAQCMATVPTGNSGPPITAMPSSATVGPTSTASYTIGINPIAGFSGPITLVASGLPAGASYSFSPATINSYGTTTLSITPSATSATGNFPIAISAQGSSQLFSANVLLVVGQPSPANLISPPPGAIVTGGNVTFSWDAGVGATQYTLTIGSQPGLSDIYAGSATSAQSATFTLSTTAAVIYVTLASNCPGPNPIHNYPFPVGSPSGTPTYTAAAWPNGVAPPVLNNEVQVVWPVCVALSAGGPCGGDARFVQSCTVSGSGVKANPYWPTTFDSTSDPNYSAWFNVVFTADFTVPPGQLSLTCLFPGGVYVTWTDYIQIVDSPPVVSFFQEYPPNPDGSFYATIWGHNFGPDPGTLQVCLQAGCGSGSMSVCLSEACGNAYYLWSDLMMFLMWQPMNYPNSIPVPIGYVTWSWGGGASYISPNWVLTNPPTMSTAMVTQPTTMYPLWSQLNPNNPVPGCPPL